MKIVAVDSTLLGDIAQLARAPALQAGGPGFESLYLHQSETLIAYRYLTLVKTSTFYIDQSIYGRLAQLARAPRLHRGGRGFEPLSAHHELMTIKTPCKWGRLAQLVRARH